MTTKVGPGPHYSLKDVCAASALLNKGGAAALDAIGVIPAFNEFTAGAKAVLTAGQMSASLTSAGMAVSGGSALDGASAGIGLGLFGAGNISLGEKTIQTLTRTTVAGSKALPIAGNIVSLIALGNDSYGKYGIIAYYNDCMAGEN